MPSQKHILLLLFLISFSFNEYSFAENSTQDTIQNFDTSAFKASLKELPPKEFARLFQKEYKRDSLKLVSSIEYIKTNMITSKDLHSQFWGYYSIAHVQNDNLNLEEAIESLDKAFAVAASIKSNELIMSSLINKGNFYFNFGDYEKAMEDYLSVLNLAKKTKNETREQAALLNIALLKMQTSDFVGADELLQKSLEYIKNQSPKLRHLRIYIALTKAAIGLSNYEKAALYCKIGLDLCEKLNEEEAKVYFYSFLTEVETKYKNFDKAHDLIEKSLTIAKDLKTIDHEIPMLYIEKGAVYYEEEEYEIAIEILLKAEILMQEHKLDFIKLEEAYALLAKSYKKLNKFEKSLEYYGKAEEAYKKNDKRQGSINTGIIKKYDLKQLREELDSAINASKKNKKNLIISVVLGGFVIIGLIFFYKKREKNNQQKFEALLANIETEKEKEKMVAKREVVAEKVSDKVAQTASKEVEIIDETKAKLLKKLQNFEKKQLFLSKHCSLNEVAKKLKTNTSYLSKLVNTHKGKSFTAYITDLRVNYAIRRLKEDKRFRSYTIDSIAQEIGFNRSESFSRAFKNKTGLYPSYFIKRLDSKGVA